VICRVGSAALNPSACRPARPGRSLLVAGGGGPDGSTEERRYDPSQQ
jgi:hypothetical protein